MIILPAIDIRHGNCVRLYQGKAERETVYSSDPVAMATLWKSKGAEMLHVVDLDGAFEGKPVNLPLITLLRKEVGIPIEVGGGFREMEHIRDAFEHGIDRIILGTAAIHNPELVQKAVEEFDDMVTVSIDVSGRFAATAGWTEISAVPFGELADSMRNLGISELLFTDTTRDGTLQGPNLNAIRLFLAAAQMPVTVSGGITCLDDISNLKELEPEGIKGVIIGKALYDNKFALNDAIRVAR
jgi:phosphoribosylformimino-5-aminoimidazole carboxamide ribotide isomerase